MLWPTVESGLLAGVRIDFEPELGGDHHLLAEGSEGFADEFFVREWAVDFGGVEEGDAAFDGRPNQRDPLLLFYGWPVGKSSVPCSRVRSLKLPDCFFQVSVFALFLLLGRHQPAVLLRFERSHIDREPVLHIRFEQSLVGFLDLLDRVSLWLPETSASILMLKEAPSMLRRSSAITAFADRQ